MSEIPTPNNMPGAEAPKAEAPKAEAPKAEAPKGVNDAISEGINKGQAELEAELARFRKIHEDESKWEKRAKQNFADAEKLRELMKSLGGEKNTEFDPKAAFEALNAKLEAAETARVLAEVARVKGVDPEDIKGSTEEEMNASADRYLARFQARLDEALKAKNVPAAPPASTVTSDGKIAGPEQITSREQLKTMKPAEIMAAQKEGRLDSLMGKT